MAVSPDKADKTLSIHAQKLTDPRAATNTVPPVPKEPVPIPRRVALKVISPTQANASGYSLGQANSPQLRLRLTDQPLPYLNRESLL